MATLHATTALTDFCALLHAPWPDNSDDQAARLGALDLDALNCLDAILGAGCGPDVLPGLTHEQRATLALAADVWAERLSEDDLHRLMDEAHERAQDAIKRGDMGTAYLHGYAAMLAEMVAFGDVPPLGEASAPASVTAARERLTVYLMN